MRPDKRILIVDDDDAIRALLFTVLRRRGFVADTARDGTEAIEKLAAGNYALMLLDLMMPMMNGYEVLAHVATLPPATRPLVLVLTAGLEPRPVDPTIVVGTMRKPFDVELLVSTIIGCTSVIEPPHSGDPDRCSRRTEEAN